MAYVPTSMLARVRAAVSNIIAQGPWDLLSLGQSCTRSPQKTQNSSRPSMSFAGGFTSRLGVTTKRLCGLANDAGKHLSANSTRARGWAGFARSSTSRRS